MVCSLCGRSSYLLWRNYTGWKKFSAGGNRLPQIFKTSFSKTTVIYDVIDPFAKENKVDLSTFPADCIRNFSIVAHIDHGKSTLADRILETTGAIPASVGNKQVLDKLQVERERGITVKAQTASIFYKYKDKTYLLNLIDTPGHVDFSYEVFRSLSACQGVILLVDANQGVQAQTVANFYLAFAANLIIIPVLNKIDLKNAKPDVVAKQIESVFELPCDSILKVSAKLGTGVEDLLKAVIERIPPPTVEISKPLRCLVFDSWFDKFKGGILLIAIKDGKLKVGDDIKSCHTQKIYRVKEVGILSPEVNVTDQLFAGQVGYITADIRNLKEIQIGDTFGLKTHDVEPVGIFKPAKPMVFAGIYPLDQTQLLNLRMAIEKLTLNDSSVSISIENSPALGQGWRLGFLGLLHMEVFNQRLSQEYDTEVIVTVPSVPYKAAIKGEKNIKLYGAELLVNNPLHFPNKTIASHYSEPMVLGTIITPQMYYGKVVALCMERRGVQTDSKNMDETTLIMQFKLPLSEIIVDFFDELKTVTSGYASFDYEECGYELAELGKLTILLNGKEVEEFTTIVPAARARKVGSHLALRLKETLPQQQFQVAIQAVFDTQVIARETMRAFRKDVAAKLKYGGDITRRMKLLNRQNEGKKRLRMVGNIELPRDTFLKILRKT